MNNFQRSLDSFIEGRNDSNNPANQTDLAEQYSTVLDECDWITDTMLDDGKIYAKLEGIFEDVIEPYFSHKHFSNKERYEFMREHANDMANKIKILWDKTDK